MNPDGEVSGEGILTSKRTKSSRFEYMRRWRLQNAQHIAEYNLACRERRKEVGRAWRIRNRARALELGRQWRQRNKEKLRIQRRAQYLLHRQSALERARRWRLRNPGLHRAGVLRSQLRHPDSANARNQRWKDKNRERVRAAGRLYARTHPDVARRAKWKRRGVEGLPKVVAQRLMALFGGLCAYGCGRQATTFDHIVPVVSGGRTNPGNILPACRVCNYSKNRKEFWSWWATLRRELPPEALRIIKGKFATWEELWEVRVQPPSDVDGGPVGETD